MSHLILHRFTLSGHSHRVECLLQLLALRYQAIDVDLAAGAHRAPDFLAMNPFGQVPVLQDGDVTLADSNAILVYLALRQGATEWLPAEPAGAARVQRWLSVAAGELAHGAALARIAVLFKRGLDLPPLQARACALLRLQEEALASAPFLAGGRPTIADLAHYGYTARADEGHVLLDPYPNVRAWLARLEALPGFLPFPSTPVDPARKA